MAQLDSTKIVTAMTKWRVSTGWPPKRAQARQGATRGSLTQAPKVWPSEKLRIGPTNALASTHGICALDGQHPPGSRYAAECPVLNAGKRTARSRKAAATRWAEGARRPSNPPLASDPVE